MELTAGSRAWAHHELTPTRGKAVPLAEVKAKGAVALRGTAPSAEAWADAVVDVSPLGGFDVAVWCDLSDAHPGEVYDVYVLLEPGDEYLPKRTGRIDVTAATA